MTKITRVYVKDGRYYYVQDLEARNPRTGRPLQKWHKLTLVDAGEAALHQALAELLGQPAPSGSDMKPLIEAFKKEHLPGLTLGVADEYTRMFTVIGEAFKDFDAAQVEPGDVVKFLKANFESTPNAKGKYKARLSTFFSWCVRNSHTDVKFNPCREIKVSSPRKRKGRFNASVWWKLHDALSPMGQCFLELTFYSRQRPTEIRLLRESAIGKERIHFAPTKTEDSSGEEVDILITPEIRAAIERARALRPKTRGVVELARKRDPFIIQTKDGDGFTARGFYEVWRDACIAAGLKGVVTTRDIRAYSLAMMEKAGHSMREIQIAAAHTDMGTTQGYIDQYRERVSDARLIVPARPK